MQKSAINTAPSARRYSLDLEGLHLACERNYARLMQLFPDYETANFREFRLDAGHRVRLEVAQRCRYTTTLRIRQHGGALPVWAPPPRFEVQAYHDVRMAEVTGFQNLRRARPRYEYPNPAMHARDEKFQQNIFLAEWLAYCLRHLARPAAVPGSAPPNSPPLSPSGRLSRPAPINHPPDTP